MCNNKSAGNFYRRIESKGGNDSFFVSRLPSKSLFFKVYLWLSLILSIFLVSIPHWIHGWLSRLLTITQVSREQYCVVLLLLAALLHRIFVSFEKSVSRCEMMQDVRPAFPPVTDERQRNDEGLRIYFVTPVRRLLLPVIAPSGT